MSAQPPPDWDHRRATLGKGQLAGHGLCIVCLCAVEKENRQNGEQPGRNEKQEETEREEPGPRDGARRGWKRHQRPNGEEQDRGDSETAGHCPVSECPGSFMLSPFHRARESQGD